MEKECRICFDNTDENLISPCECRGSMQWVHKSCLDKWIYFKKNNVCPVCHQEYNIINNDICSKKYIASFLLKSDIFTTLLTIILCFLVMQFCYYLNIRANTIALVFYGTLFGMHYIQTYFDHKEIDFDFLLNAMYTYSSHTSPYNCFNVIGVCTWLIVDKIKYKVLSKYI